MISAGKVVDPADPNLQAPVAIRFTSANSYDIVDNSNPSNPNPPVLSSGTYTEGADIPFNGWTVQISGAPQAGDTFTISRNANGTGDGLNASALASLQTANLLGSGTLTYQSAYAQMVSVVGNKTHELDITNKAEDAYLNQAVSAQQAESGVNIDEEVTNLLRYQQAYQAAGKVMQTANQLFQLLLNLGAN
jgi:flagellar hook-associated protein 1 FlgK